MTFIRVGEQQDFHFLNDVLLHPELQLGCIVSFKVYQQLDCLFYDIELIPFLLYRTDPFLLIELIPFYFIELIPLYFIEQIDSYDIELIPFYHFQ